MLQEIMIYDCTYCIHSVAGAFFLIFVDYLFFNYCILSMTRESLMLFMKIVR